MFARTERLLLRPGWAEDAPALAKAIGDHAIVRNLASAPWPYSLADAEDVLKREQTPHNFAWLFFRRTEGAPQLVGMGGFGRRPDGEVELGYWIARSYWGLGYATEAGRAIVDIARNGLRLPYLTAEHFLDNPASGRVLTNLGFRPTGEITPRFSKGRGEAAPCRLYRLELAEQRRPALSVAPEPAHDMVAA